MTFLGPLQFIKEDGTPIAVVGWEQVEGAWEALQTEAAAE